MVFRTLRNGGSWLGKPGADAEQTLAFLNSTGQLNFEEFICVLSALSRGDFAERVKWIFSLYDQNNDQVRGP